MSTDLIRYDLLVQEALKGVVRRVLTDAVRDGLPGDHHFYVSFRTDHPNARVSARLRERYPRDMTIVLQHQFDGLSVGDTAFEVGLSFSNIPERLRVPFDALTGFFDPSVQFGLKFEAVETAGSEAADSASAPSAKPVALVPSTVPKLGVRKFETVDDKPAPVAGEAGSKEETGAEVVSLDAFRKKS